MSVYSDKAFMCLYKMTQEMRKKDLELGRQIKLFSQLLLAGMSTKTIPKAFIEKVVSSQRDDGGFVGNTDTIWTIYFLSHFEEFEQNRLKAIERLKSQKENLIRGRTKRDIARIPVTGILLYLIPELRSEEKYNELKKLWESEKNSLTYKAAYFLMAASKKPTLRKEKIVHDTLLWLLTQQEDNGGFAPWKGHPVGSNVYCTGIAIIALIEYLNIDYDSPIRKAYNFLVNTQITNGLWPYHEIEDGGAWGLRALIEVEKK